MARSPHTAERVATQRRWQVTTHVAHWRMPTGWGARRAALVLTASPRKLIAGSASAAWRDSASAPSSSGAAGHAHIAQFALCAVASFKRQSNATFRLLARRARHDPAALKLVGAGERPVEETV